MKLGDNENGMMDDCSWDMNRILSKDRIFSGDIIVTHVYHKWQSYDAWDLGYKVRQTEFFVMLGHFLPFYPSNSPKNQNLKKLKKTLRDIIILHKCNKNHDYMLYCSWDVERDRCTCYFSFWANFILLTPLTAQKIKILKK